MFFFGRGWLMSAAVSTLREPACDMAKLCLQVNRPRMSDFIGRRKPGVAREGVCGVFSPEFAFSAASKRQR